VTDQVSHPYKTTGKNSSSVYHTESNYLRSINVYIYIYIYIYIYHLTI
jgi:hypothetical protein